MDTGTVQMVTSESTDMNPAMMVSATSGVDLIMPDGETNDSFDLSMTSSSPWDDLHLTSKSQPSPGEIMAEYYPVAVHFNRVFPLVLYVIGFFGNTISAVAWFQPRLSKRNSSAVYLALLSISDLVYLVLRCANQEGGLLKSSQDTWSCEIYYFFYLIPQYLAPLLVLGFTTERYVAVCHPLLRRVLCRTRVAVSGSVGMVITSVVLASIQPLFWTYSHTVGYCDLRDSIPEIESLWFYWSLVVEVLLFLVVPVVMLVLDVLVIRCIAKVNRNPLSSIRSRAVPCNGSKNEMGGKAGGIVVGGGMRGRIGGTRVGEIGVALVKPLDLETRIGRDERGEGIGTEAGGVGGYSVAGGEIKRGRVGGGGGGRGSGAERPRLAGIRVPYQATTAMILTVSLFEIVTMVSVSILYLLHDHFRRGSPDLSKEEMLADPTWQSYFSYMAAKYIILSLCLTRSAALVFFYLLLGPRFRETLWDLVRCRRKPTSGSELTRSTFAGSSLSSVKSQHQVELVAKH